MLKLQDLAHQLNLSTGTVSRALARNPLVNAATAQRVQALAEQLGYQPNQLAANLRKRQSRTIGVLVPYLRDNFFTRVVHGIEATATALGYQVLICQSGDSAEGERQALARLRQAGVMGMLISVAGSAGEQANWGAESSLAVPVVFFDRHPNQGPPASAALIDDRLGGCWLPGTCWPRATSGWRTSPGRRTCPSTASAGWATRKPCARRAGHCTPSW